MSERTKREAISKTATHVRRESERAGTPYTQQEAEARVKTAVRNVERRGE